MRPLVIVKEERLEFDEVEVEVDEECWRLSELKKCLRK